MFLIAVIIGFLLSKLWTYMVSSSNGPSLSETSSSSENTIIINNKQGQTREPVVMQTASLDEKIGPNTRLILEKKFEDCKHTVRRESEIPVEMINLTYDELKEQYSDWTIKDFSEDKVTLYRLASGLCGEHFIIEDENGVVVVYRLDEDYNKILYEVTDIYTEFLPEQDIERLEDGIYVYTVSDLNSELENLE